MREVFELSRLVAPASTTVLLTGETGTGKELIARAVHELSPRASGAVCPRELRGTQRKPAGKRAVWACQRRFYKRQRNRTGRFEAAHGGTIFLDEINSVSYTLQVKLLRVLQEQEFERVGDTKTIRVDCRIVAATNRDLLDEIEAGRFREDLYYRLNVVPIYLPPLRERSDDIPVLIEHFVRFTPRFTADLYRRLQKRPSRLSNRIPGREMFGNCRTMPSGRWCCFAMASSRLICCRLMFAGWHRSGLAGIERAGPRRPQKNWSLWAHRVR